jgi:hypothetical protein
MAKPKKLYQVIYQTSSKTCTPFTVNASSAQSACRQAFRYWIKNKELKKQPATTDDGGFENVEVII